MKFAHYLLVSCWLSTDRGHFLLQEQLELLLEKTFKKFATHLLYFAAQYVFPLLFLSTDGASKISVTISTQILNMVIKDVVEKEEWEILRFLFLGAREQRSSGGLQAVFRLFSGALASDCDASCVPLDLVLQSGVSDQGRLLAALLNQGALHEGLPKRKVTPLQVALETENYRFAVVLLKRGADPSCVVGRNTYIHGQVRVFTVLFQRRLT